MVERKGFAIYYRNKKVLKQIQEKIKQSHNGHIIYMSKKNNYCMAYCDAKIYSLLKKELMEIKGVRGVEPSHLDIDHTTFDILTKIEVKREDASSELSIEELLTEENETVK